MARVEMLYDQDGNRKIGRKRRKYLSQSPYTTCRRTYRDNIKMAH